jgi:hypothetical protein
MKLIAVCAFIKNSWVLKIGSLGEIVRFYGGKCKETELVVFCAPDNVQKRSPHERNRSIE